MSKQLRRASAIAVAAMIVSIAFSANGSGASAQSIAAVTKQDPNLQIISKPLVQPLPAETAQSAVEADRAELEPAPIKAASLNEMVAAQPQPGELSRELNCLAGAIYFEAKSESLAGQLAVGRVIVARSKSGRFPNSYCGVVFQPSQFSFVRGSSMPAIPRASKQWKNAVAIAQIAHANSWRSPVEGALFFHAAYVSPAWRLTRVGRIDNHVFYR
ncbi:cell wall hydrolase [Novosphingobium sp.]|uniref:cell wall hydrolase n=1 Tax=Novosphingobium sp. TaxID=1874826 RepID=UPI0025CE44E4|nr:cell wall hydrolase [Novosphingobium sp.]MCC6927173.1 cell wall hydrolase [Novosphingobium sp.]